MLKGIFERRIAMNEEGQRKKFWSVKELAEYLGVSKSLIYARVELDEIPCRRLGARILIPASFVDELMAIQSAIAEI